MPRLLRPRSMAILALCAAFVASACSSGGRSAHPRRSGFIPVMGDCPTRVVQSGLSVQLFARPGSRACDRSRELLTYRCPGAHDPVALVGRRAYVGGRFAVAVDGSLPGAVPIGLGPNHSVALLAPGRVPRLLMGPPSGPERWLLLPEGEQRPTGTPSVFLLGDSIMVASERVVSSVLSGWRPIFDASVGRSTAGGLEAASQRGRRLGDAAVIELGTNDKTPSQFAHRAEDLLRLIDGTPLVVWVTVHGPDPPVPSVNGEIRDVAARFANTAVADWDRAVPADGLMSDGIHPNHVGKVAMARLLEPLLDSWRAAVLGRGDRACEPAARSLARQAAR